MRRTIFFFHKIYVPMTFYICTRSPRTDGETTTECRRWELVYFRFFPFSHSPPNNIIIILSPPPPPSVVLSLRIIYFTLRLLLLSLRRYFCISYYNIFNAFKCLLYARYRLEAKRIKTLSLYYNQKRCIIYIYK